MKFWEGAWLLKEVMSARAKNPRSICPTPVITPASVSGTRQALPATAGLCILSGICQATPTCLNASCMKQQRWFSVAIAYWESKPRKGPGPSLTNHQTHQQPYLDLVQNLF